MAASSPVTESRIQEAANAAEKGSEATNSDDVHPSPFAVGERCSYAVDFK